MAWRGGEGGRPPSAFLSGNLVRDPAFLPLGLWVTNAVKARVRSAWLGLPLPSLPCLVPPGWVRFWGLSLSHPSLQHRKGNGHTDWPDLTVTGCDPAVVIKESHLHVSVWINLWNLWLNNPAFWTCTLCTLKTDASLRIQGFRLCLILIKCQPVTCLSFSLSLLICVANVVLPGCCGFLNIMRHVPCRLKILCD